LQEDRARLGRPHEEERANVGNVDPLVEQVPHEGDSELVPAERVDVLLAAVVVELGVDRDRGDTRLAKVLSGSFRVGNGDAEPDGLRLVGDRSVTLDDRTVACLDDERPIEIPHVVTDPVVTDVRVVDIVPEGVVAEG
jgi:hypothetical protein